MSNEYLVHFWKIVCQLTFVLLLHTEGFTQSLSCDINLKSFRVNNDQINSDPDFTGKAHLAANPKTGQWRVDYIDNNQKFACTYRDFILEKPNYDGTNAWYIISPVERGYPIDLDFDERLIWFAYCGKDYLREREGQPVVLLYGDTRSDPSVYGCRMTTKWRSDIDLCPQAANFTFDADLFQENVKQLSIQPSGTFLDDRQKQVEQFSSNHTNGQLIATFKVLRWADNLQIGIPIKWEYNLYWYGQNMVRCIGEADNVKTTETEVVLPNLPLAAKITDKRVRSVSKGINNSIYLLTDGNIPNVQGVDLSKAMRMAPRTSSQTPPNSAKIRVFFILIMIAVGIIPLVIYMRKKA